MRFTEFVFSEKLYNKIDQIKNNDKYFYTGLEVLANELLKTNPRNVLVGQLEPDLEQFEMHFLANEPRTHKLLLSAKSSRVAEQAGLTLNDIENIYNNELGAGRVYLGVHKTYKDYGLNIYSIGGFINAKAL